MNDDDLEYLISEEFLSNLESESKAEKSNIKNNAPPSWVIEDQRHTTYKAWLAILMLKREKEQTIMSLGKVLSKKVPKGYFQLKKSEVASVVGISAQSIFRTSTFSNKVLAYFDDTNSSLLKLYQAEKNRQMGRYRPAGIRPRSKQELVDEAQAIRKQIKILECRQVKETLDLLLSQMPIDLKRRLRM
ncbi:conserved hypothetical protein [Vibrio nigripulchritudo POn4]|uniref:hypothetical protein n=1 Tax=Vibrio nigripulchritudo TaxID=28173 RepID=UPI0003B1DF70|nr:hypothetical protein [Vibrio nigripulchritudo]CCN63548.1 conserved hypothetical protein [Vibrio nigripulchritudo POn4]